MGDRDSGDSNHQHHSHSAPPSLASFAQENGALIVLLTLFVALVAALPVLSDATPLNSPLRLLSPSFIRLAVLGILLITVALIAPGIRSIFGALDYDFDRPQTIGELANRVINLVLLGGFLVVMLLIVVAVVTYGIVTNLDFALTFTRYSIGFAMLLVLLPYLGWAHRLNQHHMGLTVRIAHVGFIVLVGIMSFLLWPLLKPTIDTGILLFAVIGSIIIGVGAFYLSRRSEFHRKVTGARPRPRQDQ